MENKKEMKIFLCLLRKKRVALFIPSTFFFFLIFKLLSHIVMLKMIHIYPFYCFVYVSDETFQKLF